MVPVMAPVVIPCPKVNCAANNARAKRSKLVGLIVLPNLSWDELRRKLIFVYLLGFAGLPRGLMHTEHPPYCPARDKCTSGYQVKTSGKFLDTSCRGTEVTQS